MASITKDLDGNKSYFHPVMQEPFTSVTTITSGTISKPWLANWAAKLAAIYAAGNMPRLMQILVNDEAGADGVIDLVKGASKRAREAKADAGNIAHKVAETLIRWEASAPGDGQDVVLPVIPADLADVDMDGIPLRKFVQIVSDGFLNFVGDFKPEFLGTELIVYNRPLRYAGTLDFIMVLHGVKLGMRGKLVPAPGQSLRICVDIKTGKQLDSTVREQVEAYRQCDELEIEDEQLGAMIPTDCGAVLHLRPEYERYYRLMMVCGDDAAAAWNSFRRAQQLFTERQAARDKPGRVVYPLLPDGTAAPTRLCDLDGEGYGQVPGALRKNGLETTADVAALTAVQCRELSGIGPKSITVIERMLADDGRALTRAAHTEAAAGEVA